MAQIADNTPQPTLIFIPDISGFTEFVHDTDVSHSQHIIQELLETIIDSNTLNLEISEIEGDAVLFYRMGEAPDSAELLRQVRTMYEQFHSHLKRYESQRICHCGACSTAHNLRLKFVAHYGDLSTSKVKNFTKLFGKDLIVAHRLLKNKIDLDEYILVTHALSTSCPDWNKLEDVTWADAVTGRDTYDFGEMEYIYIPMAPLYDQIPEPSMESYTLGNSVSIGTLTREFNAPIQMAFDVLSDVSYKHHWQPGLKDSAELNGAITKNGSTHRCVINGNNKDPFVISHSFDSQNQSVTWSETDVQNDIEVVLRLDRIDENRTLLTQELFVDKNPFVRFFLKHVFGAKLRKNSKIAHQNLDEYFAKLQSEQSQHHTQVVLRPETVMA